jgi:hypothetical protein
VRLEVTEEVLNHLSGSRAGVVRHTQLRAPARRLPPTGGFTTAAYLSGPAPADAS